MASPIMKTMAGACVAALSAVSLLADASAASAQSGDYNNGQGDPAPPSGQYAPPPEGVQSGAAYDSRAQGADREYAARYSAWAAQNCVDQRNNNTAAGAVIGGVLGAVVGAGVAGPGNRGAGAVIGGALGAGTGAAVGASSASSSCPPGYVIRAGAPVFAYSGYYAPGYVYGPAWYRPWVWYGGRWVYRPYRYWYWNHRAYWRPGWRARPYVYRYYRW